jgi:hypothetical protein
MWYVGQESKYDLTPPFYQNDAALYNVESLK